MDWMEKLLDSFFSFRSARNWCCRFPGHNGAHYQDEVAPDSSAVEWRLHGHVIARLSRLEGGRLLLELRDAGYPTLTTVSRLNAILWKLGELWSSPKMEFRLKYARFGGDPDHTMLLVGGKAYNLNLFPGKTVRILIDPREGRAAPELPPSAEYLYFMLHPELEPLRRLYRGVNKLINVVDELMHAPEKFLASNGGFEELSAEYRDLCERRRKLEEELQSWRFAREARASLVGAAELREAFRASDVWVSDGTLYVRPHYAEVAEKLKGLTGAEVKLVPTEQAVFSDEVIAVWRFLRRVEELLS